MLDRDTAPRKLPSTRLSGKTCHETIEIVAPHPWWKIIGEGGEVSTDTKALMLIICACIIHFSLSGLPLVGNQGMNPHNIHV